MIGVLGFTPPGFIPTSGRSERFGLIPTKNFEFDELVPSCPSGRLYRFSFEFSINPPKASLNLPSVLGQSPKVALRGAQINSTVPAFRKGQQCYNSFKEGLSL